MCECTIIRRHKCLQKWNEVKRRLNVLIQVRMRQKLTVPKWRLKSMNMNTVSYTVLCRRRYDLNNKGPYVLCLDLLNDWIIFAITSINKYAPNNLLNKC